MYSKAKHPNMIDTEKTKLIEPKPFPKFEEFINELVKADPRHKERFCYNYFAEFGVREVFPEVGKEYEFSTDGMIWEKVEFGGFKEAGTNWTFKYIRPIQPSRLEQLKSKHPNLTDTEQKELLDLLLTQTK
jgi:hypothetical protein